MNESNLPELPPIKREPELVGMHDDNGGLEIIDTAIPDDLRVADVLGERTAKRTMGVEVDGVGLFSAAEDGTLVAIGADGQLKRYNPATGQWETAPDA